MACNSRWLNNYYYRPIQEIDTFIRNYQRRTTITHSTPTVIPDFGCAPVNMTCNYCGEAITTITESKFNIFACFCCMLFNLLYCCVQICSNKNPCCCNINHRCPKCGRVVGEYNSCWLFNKINKLLVLFIHIHIIIWKNITILLINF